MLKLVTIFGIIVETFESKERILPDFDESTCCKYFQNVLKLKRKNKSFGHPSWLKPLNNPVSCKTLNHPHTV